MKDASNKQNKGVFKKRAHRPWKSTLLEQTIQETTLELENSLLELDLDLDLDLEPTEESNTFYPELGFTSEIITTVNNPTPTVAATTIIESKAKDAAVDKDQHNPDAKPVNKILLGGFFKTQQTISQSNLEATRKINSLLADLKIRELNTEANEAKVRQAIEQANIISQQFNTALEQANKAATAHQAEVNLRMQIEAQLKDAQLLINSIQPQLQTEKQMRLALEQSEADLRLQLQASQQALMAAEAETQHSLANVTFMKDLEIELENAIEKLAQVQFENNAAEQELTEMRQRYANLNNQLATITAQLNEQDNKFLELDAKNQKLKAIIATEQKLRKIAEQQVQEFSERAEKGEKVLHLLNGSVVPEAKSAPEKKAVIISYAYEPDDLEY